jgi:predicted ATPase
MITRIEVDGFKSLKGFGLNFAKGLNILVGPNGAGKTNIVSFFEFVAHLMETDASEATSRVGGAGAVFRRVGQEYERTIKARIVGCVALNTERRRPDRSEKAASMPFCIYDYSFSLVFPEARDSVLFDTQRLRLRRVADFSCDFNEVETPKWGLDLEARYQHDGTTAVTTNAFDESLLDLPYYPARRRDSKEQRPTPDQILGRMLTSNNISLVALISRYTPEMWPLAGDLTGGQIYNIVPSKLKLPEDSAKPPGIARDGSGLASTLYALQRSKEPLELGPWSIYHRTRGPQYEAASLDQLKQYLNLVNNNVQDISVINDTFDNQLRVRFTIKSGDYDAVLPMGLMSDGTLKWLAVVTAAVTARSVFCIEEPENYLHPQMQGQIVTILREILFRQEVNRFSIMTTHSETLLNHCLPNELIIVSMNGGRTEAKRCTNAEDISQEIKRTGFGLGYYFVSNAIQND